MFLLSCFLIYLFSTLDWRRTANFETLVYSLSALSLDDFLNLGGGRFLSNFSAYQQSFTGLFDFSGFMLDLPSVDVDSLYRDSLIEYSGLASSFIDSRRPNSILAWTLYNLRFFSLPYILTFVFMLANAFRNSFLIPDSKRRCFFHFSFFVMFYLLVFASPNSFFSPLMILSILSLPIVGSERYRV